MSEQTIKCPDCLRVIQKRDLKQHIIGCKSYNPSILNNTLKLTEHLNSSYLNFIIAELDIAKEQLLKKTEKEKKMNGSSLIDLFVVEPTIRVEDHHDLPPKNNTKEVEQNNKIKVQKSYVTCSSCQKQLDANQVQDFTYTYFCFHLLCKQCLISYIQDQYVKKKGSLKCLSKDCSDDIPTEQIKEIMGDSFEKLQKQLLRQMMNIVVCSKCSSEFQFVEGHAKDAPKKDTNGKPLSKKSSQEYAKYRFVCSNEKCKTEQCKNCKASPYHLGMTCIESHEFQQAKQIKKQFRKCRYCKNALKKGYTSHLGIRSFDNICNRKQCEKLSKMACSKIHACKHPCLGYKNEKNCLPCLDQKCAKGVIPHDQNSESYCSLCFIQDLQAKPCVKSECGHIYHYQCLQKRLNIRWLTPRILFTFCHCPLCKKWVDLPKDCPLSPLLEKNKALMEDVKSKANRRLKYEELDKDKKVTESSSPYYKKPQEYALAIYAYFECYKCKKPYFGGRKNCAEVMNAEGRDNQEYDAKKLICPECCPIPIKNCEKHGKEFVAFKCKFCCSIAQWFCWGNTHFCDACHKKQIQGKYVSKMKKQDLPACEGADKCPSGGNHGGNGEEYSLGCLLCRNYKEEKKDF